MITRYRKCLYKKITGWSHLLETWWGGVWAAALEGGGVCDTGWYLAIVTIGWWTPSGAWSTILIPRNASAPSDCASNVTRHTRTSRRDTRQKQIFYPLVINLREGILKHIKFNTLGQKRGRGIQTCTSSTSGEYGTFSNLTSVVKHASTSDGYHETL